MNQNYNFIIVRNAETDLDILRPKVLSGQMERSLNTYGKLQAASLAERLSEIALSEIYTSDQTQAIETAQKILSHQKNVKLITDQRLRECHTGNLTGMSFMELDALSQESNISLDGFLDQVGESSEDFQRRVQEFYDKVIVGSILADDHHDNSNACRMQNMLIISHSGWIDAFMHFLINDLNFEVLSLQNRFPYKASIYEFKILKTFLPGEDYGRWSGIVTRMNDASHLATLSNMIQNDADRVGLLKLETPIGNPFTARREIMIMLGMQYCSFFKNNERRDSTPLGKTPSKDIIFLENCSQNAVVEDVYDRRRSLGW